MLTRMLMTTVAALVVAAPVAAQDQAKPATAQQQELQKQEQQGAPATAAQDQPATAAQDQPAPATQDQPATAAQDQPAEAAPGAQPPAMTAQEPVAGEAAEVAEEEETPPADMQFLTEQEAEQFLAADEVIGKDVVNANDEEVGEIADLVMDPDQKLVGVVLSVGGFLGLGEKWVAVPVDSIQFPTDEQPARLLVAVTKDQLENAPDFVTRDTVEAQQAAEEAQQMQQQQMQQAPAPATTTQ